MTSVPAYHEFINPMLDALRDLGGKASIDDLNLETAKRAKLTKEVLDVPHGDGDGAVPEAFYRMGWTRTYLKKVGLLANEERGVWSLTPEGAASSDVDPQKIVQQVQARIEPDMEEPELPPHIADELLGSYERLLDQNTGHSPGKTEAAYRTFRARFGPDVLATLEGKELLETMHGRGKDRLVYWLEFKDDEEMPGIFGSIAGGSALKFGIYQSADTGHWMTGHPKAQKRLTLDEAIELVQEQKRQLLAGIQLLSAFEGNETRDAYAKLHDDMMAVAPRVADSAWGHKYFALLFPDVLDDYHAVDYQVFNLVKLQKHPTSRRYENAFFFTAIARQLGIPPTSLGWVLNHRNGTPHRYWRIGTTDEKGHSEWARMRDGGFAAVGWDALGDLSHIERTQTSKEELRALMETHYPGRANIVSRTTNQLHKFVCVAQERDILVAMEGKTVKGVGRLTGGYQFQPGDGPFPQGVDLILSRKGS